jgi:glycosyltransferase involved in cell wall biosynthesis
MILTYNEEPNISRCLEKLQWARRVLVIDSGSTDQTLVICNRFPNVMVVHRKFDSFANQCNFGLEQISTDWVLSLDCDYILTDPLISEIADTTLDADAHGLRCGFRYCMGEKVLRATLYPPRTVLYRRTSAHYLDDGHGHKVQINGPVVDLSGRIHHDDRKPLSRWLSSQWTYAQQEVDKLESSGNATHGMADKLRKMIWPAAPAAFCFSLFYKRLILDGWAGFFYTLQRTYAELLLSLALLERKVMGSRDSTPQS